MKATLMKLAFNTIAASALLSFSFTALALSDSATPATPDAPATPQIAPTKPGLHFVLNGGLTYGGDIIDTAEYRDGSSTDIKAGALLQGGIGVLYQLENQPLALMMSVNYHFHSAMGSNGEDTFDRIPVEILAYYTGKERFRIGGGVRILNSPEWNKSVDGFTQKATFENATGLVAEIGYQMSSPAWLNFRFVSEKYQAKSYTSTSGTTWSMVGSVPFSGSHLGVNYSYEF